MVKALILTGSLWLSAGMLYAQTDSLEMIIGGEPMTYVEVMPKFRGGQDSMYRFIAERIIYPPLARAKGIQGMVVVKFVVDVDSLLKRIQVVRRIGGGCDEEVLRIMHLMNSPPMWIPSHHNGIPVPVIFTLPVKFTLQDNSPKKGKG